MSALFNTLLAVHFLRPWWLLGLLLLPVLMRVLRRRSGPQNVWQEIVDPHLLPHLLDRSTEIQTSGIWAKRLGLLGAVLAIVAMAGPSFGKSEQPLWQARQPLVIAVDLSRAAYANDVQPSRLAQMRAKLAMLLRERNGGQVGLVAFADDAFTVAPLTDDANNVALFLDALSPDVMPADGQRADRAIAWSQKLLQQAGFPQGDIVLLTDHADARAIAEAKRAHAAGYQVSVLGVGTAHGGVFEGVSGLVRTQFDAGSLQALAASGGGRYAALTATDADVRALGVLDPRQAGSVSKQTEQTTVWRDDGYWLLPLVLLCWLPLFRRGRGALLALSMLCVLPIFPVDAQTVSAPQGGLWQRSDQAAYAQMQEAIRRYDKKDYVQASQLLQQEKSADGLYNLGNALAQQGRYDEALAAYDQALKQQPTMADALYNRKVVAAAKKQQQHKQQQNKQQDQQSKDQQGQQQQGQQQGQNQAQNKNQNQGQKQQQQNQPQESSSANAQDEQKQRQADAAQREQMRQALNKTQQKAESARAAAKQNTPAVRDETPAQRERRLANQAWLQRVPDDPGALLRARFQLEARRRQEGVP